MKTFDILKTTILAGIFFLCFGVSTQVEAQNKLRIISAKASSTYSYQESYVVKKKATNTGTFIDDLGDGLVKDETKYRTITCGANLAIDGKTNGNLPTGKSVFHSNKDHPWWEADLGAVYDISRIKLYNRTDGWKDRLSNFYIMVSESPIRSSSTTRTQFGNGPMDAESEAFFQTTDNKKGRYVRIFIDDYDAHLQLAEVEIFGYKAQANIVRNNFTPSTGGPNISGAWKLNYQSETMANFVINTGAKSIIIKMEEGSEADPETREYFNYDNLNGEYGWNATQGCYQKGSNMLFKTNNGSLAFRYQNGQKQFKLTKNSGEASLEDLFGGGGANTQALWGEWNVEGKTAGVELMGGANSDLVIKLGTDLFEVNKVSTGYPDKYEDESGSTTLTFVSNNKMKMSVGEKSINLIRVGGSAATGGALNELFGATGSPAGGDGGGVNQRDASGNTPLHKAVKNGELENAEEIMDLGADLNMKNNSGKTPLMEALSKGNADIASALIDKGANVNMKDNQGKTALDLAISKSDDDAIDLLLDNNAIVSTTAITNAVKKKDKDLLGKLIDGGGNASHAMNETAKTGNIPMFKYLTSNHGDKATVTNQVFDKAIAAKKYPLAQMMISKGVDANHAMNVSTQKGLTDMVYIAMEEGGDSNKALEYAVKKKDEDLTNESIKSYQADPNTGLKTAVLNKNVKMVDLLVSLKADPNMEMEYASINGLDKIVESLVNGGGDPSLGSVPAMNAGNYSTVKLLVGLGADPNPILPLAVQKQNKALVETCIIAEADPQGGMNPAIELQDVEITKILLAAGADGTSAAYIQSVAGKGNNILTKILLDANANAQDGIMAAVKNNHAAVTTTLIEAGADGSDSDLLITSVPHNNADLTAVLLKAGADPDMGVDAAVNSNAGAVLTLFIKEGSDVSAPKYLRTAVDKTNVSVARVLLENGHDPNSAVDESKGYTLLHTAVVNSSVDMTALLLNKGADVNAPTTEGKENTPLHICVGKGKKHVNLAKTLINKGADVNAINAEGKLVFKLAKSMKMKRLLKKSGARKK